MSTAFYAKHTCTRCWKGTTICAGGEKQQGEIMCMLKAPLCAAPVTPHGILTCY